MSLNITLSSGLSGLMTAQRGLDLIAQNIANVNTEGYTRKIASPQSLAVAGDSVGVSLSRVQREVDEALFRTILGEQGQLSKLTTDDRFYTHMQQLFGSPGEEGTVSHQLTKLNQALETLATQPSKAGSQSMAVQAAVDFADLLARLSEDIQELRIEADGNIAQVTTDISEKLQIIRESNELIARNNALNTETADLEDRRDNALRELSELIDINYFRQRDGSMTIYTGSGRVLLDRYPKDISHQKAATLDAGMTYAEGNFAGIMLNGVDITGEIKSGKLKSLIELRDGVLPDLQAELDALAARVKDEVNIVHNRSTSFPGMATTMEGTRAFVDTANQGIALGGEDDVAIVLYDGDGNGSASTTLRDVMDTYFGGGSSWAVGSGATGTATIDDIQAALDNWVSANAGGGSVSIVDGRLQVNIDGTGYGLAFRDLPGGAVSDTPQDVDIRFDADGNGSYDAYESSVSGFSNFFGLNDLFVDDRARSVHDSEIKAASWVATAASSMTFYDGPVGTPLGTVNVSAGDSLEAIAASINALGGDLSATVVPEGAGYRLRVRHSDGSTVTVVGSAVARLGMAASNNAAAGRIEVREDIAADAGKIGRGAVQQDAGGAFFVSEGDNETVLQMAEALTRKHSFATSGNITRGNYSLAEFGATIVSLNSSAASATTSKLDYQEALTADLKYQRETESGVNLDEEMSNILLYQQAYAAAAKVITTTQRLFEILDNLR